MNDAWVNLYVGMPYNHADCYRLVRMVLFDQCGIVLPEVPIPEDVGARVAAIAEHCNTTQWRHIHLGDEQMYDVAELVLPVATLDGWRHVAAHLGVIVAPGRVLHTLPPHGAHVSRYGRHGLRPAGIWRWCK